MLIFVVLLLDQQTYRLNMRGLREQVDRLHLLDFIACRGQELAVILQLAGLEVDITQAVGLRISPCRVDVFDLRGVDLIEGMRRDGKIQPQHLILMDQLAPQEAIGRSHSEQARVLLLSLPVQIPTWDYTIHIIVPCQNFLSLILHYRYFLISIRNSPWESTNQVTQNVDSEKLPK